MRFIFFFQAEDGIRDYKVTGVQTCALPISSLNRTNRELAALALLDPLTGLPNRRCLTDELGRLIARCARSQECVGVGFIDLDRFKNVNDEHGHRSEEHTSELQSPCNLLCRLLLDK